MNQNIHYKQFYQWKQVSLGLLVFLIFICSVIQIVSFYSLYCLKAELKNVSHQESECSAYDDHALTSVIQEIDTQPLHALIDALVEIMPPRVKIEKLEYRHKNNLQLHCSAQDNASMLHFIDACSHHRILNVLKLKKSLRHDDSFLFDMSSE